MKPGKYRFAYVSITVLITLLLIAISLTGLLTSGFYSKEAFNWQIQSIGQDKIDLFLTAPILMITGIISAKNKKLELLYAGTLLYIVYTFLIYCFDVHFNRLFLAYCLMLGLSVYTLGRIIHKQVKLLTTRPVAYNKAGKMTGVYFISVSVLFYFLWLADIIPSIINNKIPESLEQSGLPSNPVHVIDLSFFLPAVFITGVLLLRKKATATMFAVILLSFFVLMNITIGWLAFEMKQKGLTADDNVPVVMALLTLFSLALLVWNLKSVRGKEMINWKNDSQNIQSIKSPFRKFYERFR